MKAPIRLDQALVTRGLAPSRARAQALVAAGVVEVAGKPASRASQKVGDEAIIVTADPNPYVSRAALKLVHALDHFALDPAGATALDVGASTGGFTEVLLERGAAEVHALDVGRDQLHPKLRRNPKVHVLEGLNARDLTDQVPPVDWVVSDVSFISLTKALPRPLALAKPGATLIALVKPQFELSPPEIGKGGIVRDPELHTRACQTATDFVTAEGWTMIGLTESPITGSDGNREFLLAAQKLTLPTDRPDQAGHSPSPVSPSG